MTRVIQPMKSVAPRQRGPYPPGARCESPARRATPGTAGAQGMHGMYGTPGAADAASTAGTHGTAGAPGTAAISGARPNDGHVYAR
ncbi:hypothetical protein ACFYYH_17925 [Streptomyces sp. NPDC002018]|uniref:hypothetical protein n=1 Tax=Streptomyces sp. NPDC002018 TaxID=3364629 RepID=UPI0036BFE700